MHVLVCPSVNVIAVKLTIGPSHAMFLSRTCKARPVWQAFLVPVTLAFQPLAWEGWTLLHAVNLAAGTPVSQCYDHSLLAHVTALLML